MYRRTNNLSLNASSPLATGQTQPETQPVASTSTLPDSPATNDGSTTPSSASSKRKLRPSTSTRDPSTPKRTRQATSGAAGASHTPPTARLADLGGVDACIESMLELVALPLTHPEVYLHTGVRPPRGVLLVGPPGCGKTMLAGAIAGVSSLFLLCSPFLSSLISFVLALIGTWNAVHFNLGTFNRFWNVRRIRKAIEGNFRRSSCE